MYVDWDYYTEDYSGTVIPEQTAFDGVLKRAEAYLNRLTHGKSAGYESLDETTLTALKDATCTAAEILYRKEVQDSGQTVASETVGNHSRSYTTAATADYEKAIAGEVYNYLVGTSLAYRGVFY